MGHVPTSILNLFFVGEGPPQWLATGALACRPAVALLAGPGAPQPMLVKNLITRAQLTQVVGSNLFQKM